MAPTTTQVFDKPPFSKEKYRTDPVVHHFYMNGPIFYLSLFENTQIFAQIFSSETKIVIFL